MINFYSKFLKIKYAKIFSTNFLIIVINKTLNTLRYYRPESIRYRKSQRGNYELFKKSFPGRVIYYNVVDNSKTGHSLRNEEAAQYAFVSNQLYKIKPQSILDVGSHIGWLYGVGSYYKIKTLDIRGKPIKLDSEENFVGSAECLPFSDASQEVVTSICSLEHFGLGRYGDEIDPFGDIKAIAEVYRVLRGGYYIFTTFVTTGDTYIIFNARRVYSLKEIRKMLKGYKLETEQFFSMSKEKVIDEVSVSSKIGLNEADLYFVCCRKI